MLKSIKLNAALKMFAIFFIVLGLMSCGGGGGGGGGGGSGSEGGNRLSGITGNGEWQAGVFESADNYENSCTTLQENNFLRSWSNDTYLWYNEIEDQDPSLFLSTNDYFDILKTNATTASGKNKDNFHFTYVTTVWDGRINSGVDTGYGITWAWLSGVKPRNFLVSYTEPGSPAANNNLQRGAQLLKVDGVDFIESDDVDALNAGLFPSAHGEVHTFEVQDLGSTTPRTITLTSGAITKVPVQNVTVLNTATGKVGYFLFNDHLATAEEGLIDAVNQLRQANITDLVLDVRYNGGGYLYIASELAYMIAGHNKTANKTFEKTTFNDKHASVGLGGESLKSVKFSETSDTGDALPSLNLNRVFIITSGNTCSASESVINSLRGINVEVIQIGSKTCGKPYGFYPRDNCGTTYFTIQFKGVNAKGFGEYADGFTPSEIDNGLDNIKGCESGDDFSHLLGDANESNLASALQYRATGTCLVSSGSEAVRLQKASVENYSNVRAALNKEKGLTNRIMR